MNRYMKSAIREAYRGIENGHGGPFGAVIVKDGRIVAKGHNEVLKNHDATCHGEVMAIRAKQLDLIPFQHFHCQTGGEPILEERTVGLNHNRQPRQPLRDPMGPEGSNVPINVGNDGHDTPSDPDGLQLLVEFLGPGSIRCFYKNTPFSPNCQMG